MDINELKRMLEKNKNQIAIGLDSCAALAINGDDFEAFSSDENAKVYKIYY